MRSKAVETIEKAIHDTVTPITRTFTPEQSPEQVVPIIDSLVNDIPRTFLVNIPNHGPIIKGYPEDLVVECQGLVNGSGIHGITVPDLPRKLVAEIMNPHWCRAEMAVEAVKTGDRNILLSYLLSNPQTKSLEQAERLIDAWLAEPQNGLCSHFH